MSSKTHTLLAMLLVAMPVPLVADEEDSGAVTPVESRAEPVTGAFGLTLGMHFEPAMVAQVISETEMTYRGPNNAELVGTEYAVVPMAPDERFNLYKVSTAVDGSIYAIRAEFHDPGKSPRCQAAKEIAASLEQRHGKPRGKGMSGDWYAFRDMSVEHYRGIRLYANRCDQGIYEIIYSDDSVRKAVAPP